MNREKAIEIFKRLKENAPNEMHLETVGSAQELFDMAIQALSQEPCDDAISRQAVINAIENDCMKGGLGSCFACYNDAQAFRGEIEKLPSVTHKSGKWINDKDDMPTCSQCGYIPPYSAVIDDYEYSNYCPNCGACMKDGRTLDEFIEDSKERSDKE